MARDRTVFTHTLGDVIVMENGQHVVATDAWTYKIAGSIDSVQPFSGHYGTVVTIQGTSLLGHASRHVTSHLLVWRSTRC